MQATRPHQRTSVEEWHEYRGCVVQPTLGICGLTKSFGSQYRAQRHRFGHSTAQVVVVIGLSVVEQIPFSAAVMDSNRQKAARLDILRGTRLVDHGEMLKERSLNALAHRSRHGVSVVQSVSAPVGAA